MVTRYQMTKEIFNMEATRSLNRLTLILFLLNSLAFAGIDYHLGTGLDGDLVVSGTVYTDEVRSSVISDNVSDLIDLSFSL